MAAAHAHTCAPQQHTSESSRCVKGRQRHVQLMLPTQDTDFPRSRDESSPDSARFSARASAL